MGFTQGLSGLNAASRDLTTIGNNIANSQTVGYKVGRTEFADMFAGSVGLGVKVSDISRNFSGGPLNSTGRDLDLALNGEGFFRLTQGDQVVYSRNGQFHRTKEGYIANAQGALLTGYNVQGFNSGNPYVSASGNPGTIQLPTTGLNAVATTDASLVADLNAGADMPKNATFDPADSDSFNWSTPYTVYDSLGNSHNVNLYFAKSGTNTWNVYGRMALGSAATWSGTVNGSGTYPGGFDPVNFPGQLNGSHSVSVGSSDYVVNVSGATRGPGTWNTGNVTYTMPTAWSTSVGGGGLPDGTDLSTSASDPNGTHTFTVDGVSFTATVAGATGSTGSWSGGTISYAPTTAWPAAFSGGGTYPPGFDPESSPTNPNGSYTFDLGGYTFDATVAGATGTAGTWSGGEIAYSQKLSSPISLAFDNSGNLQTVGGGTNSVAEGLTFNAHNGSNPITFDLNFGGSTQTAQEFRASGVLQNGHAAGDLVDIAITKDGTVRGAYSNGETVGLAQLTLARFASTYGLQATGDNAYIETGASGQALLGSAGSGQYGNVLDGTLEGSNVDMAQQLVDMIVAQRTYQANAKTITTQSQLMQTAIQMAR